MSDDSNDPDADMRARAMEQPPFVVKMRDDGSVYSEPLYPRAVPDYETDEPAEEAVKSSEDDDHSGPATPDR